LARFNFTAISLFLFQHLCFSLLQKCLDEAVFLLKSMPSADCAFQVLSSDIAQQFNSIFQLIAILLE